MLSFFAVHCNNPARRFALRNRKKLAAGSRENRVRIGNCAEYFTLKPRELRVTGDDVSPALVGQADASAVSCNGMPRDTRHAYPTGRIVPLDRPRLWADPKADHYDLCPDPGTTGRIRAASPGGKMPSSSDRSSRTKFPRRLQSSSRAGSRR